MENECFVSMYGYISSDSHPLFQKLRILYIQYKQFPVLSHKKKVLSFCDYKHFCISF